MSQKWALMAVSLRLRFARPRPCKQLRRRCGGFLTFVSQPGGLVDVEPKCSRIPPRNSNIDTQNDGFQKVTPASNMAMCDLYVRFQGCI